MPHTDTCTDWGVCRCSKPHPESIRGVVASALEQAANGTLSRACRCCGRSGAQEFTIVGSYAGQTISVLTDVRCLLCVAKWLSVKAESLTNDVRAQR